MCTAESHRAIKQDAAAWAALPKLGVQRFDFNDGEPPTAIELRNCSKCASTLAIEIPIEAVAA